MLAIVSPAKTLDFEKTVPCSILSQPEHLSAARRVVKSAQALTVDQLQTLMGISSKLANLNFTRFREWSGAMGIGRQAIFAYSGDVYEGIDAYTLTTSQLKFINKHVRILSGLYGILQPFDLIEPYRLEMGIKLKVADLSNLYAFWTEIVTNSIVEALCASGEHTLLNLASNEYSRVLNKELLPGPMITPAFKEERSGKFQMVSFFAKRARGLMVRYIAENKVNHPSGIIDFHADGYTFNKQLSSCLNPVFTRKI